MKPTAFTRTRRLPLAQLTAFLLNAPRAGLQAELEAFFDHALGSNQARALSKSALCQARRQLRPEALRDLVGHSARVFAEGSRVPHWHGRRVLALDSTTLRVPDVPECAEHFGGMTPACGRFRPLARASAILDVARGAFVDARGWRVKLNRTLTLKSLRHYLPRLLLALDLNQVLGRLIERLRAPTAIERTRPDRKAPRKKGVRIAGFHPAYKAA